MSERTFFCFVAEASHEEVAEFSRPVLGLVGVASPALLLVMAVSVVAVCLLLEEH